MDKVKKLEQLSLSDAIARDRLQDFIAQEEKRLSFVMGSLGRNSTTTRAQVEEMLAKQEGKKRAQ